MDWLEPERIVVNLYTLFKDVKGIDEKPDWGKNAEMLVEARKLLERRYGDRLKPYDPYTSWDI